MVCTWVDVCPPTASRSKASDWGKPQGQTAQPWGSWTAPAASGPSISFPSQVPSLPKDHLTNQPHMEGGKAHQLGAACTPGAAKARQGTCWGDQQLVISDGWPRVHNGWVIPRPTARQRALSGSLATPPSPYVCALTSVSSYQLKIK